MLEHIGRILEPMSRTASASEFRTLTFTTLRRCSKCATCLEVQVLTLVRMGVAWMEPPSTHATAYATWMYRYT